MKGDWTIEDDDWFIEIEEGDLSRFRMFMEIMMDRKESDDKQAESKSLEEELLE